MKKINKILITAFIWLILGTINATAATGTKGICYGRELVGNDPANMGYCWIYDNHSGLDIYHTNFSANNLPLTNGKQASQLQYYTTYSGQRKDLFCLDPNLDAPYHGYPIARPLDIGNGNNNNYDTQIARAYLLYLDKSVTDGDLQRYLQVANVVMRAITRNYGYSIEGGSMPERLVWYDHIISQLKNGDSSSVPAVKLNSTAVAHSDFTLARQWYCSATKANCSGVSNQNVEFRNFDLKIKGDKDKVETTPEGESFTRKMPVTVSGLAEFTKDAKYNTSIDGNPAPYVYISEVKCLSDKMTKCDLVDSSGNTVVGNQKNLLSYAGTNDTLELYIIYGGKVLDFKTEQEIKAKITYEYYHILDVYHLAALRYSITDQFEQRMLMVSPNGSIKNAFVPDLGLPIDASCKYEPGTDEYFIGSEKANSVTDYMAAGCCDVDMSKLDEEGIESYKKYCATEDIVILAPQCKEIEAEPDPNNNICNNPISTEDSESYVIQQDIKDLMDKVKLQDEALKNKHINETKYYENLKAYDNNRDDVYLYTNIATDNKYCRMYTSEESKITYPGSETAKSGRYFVFRNGTQPMVESSIKTDFHTNIDQWLKDYEEAIELEKKAFTAWQSAEALEEAIGKLERTCNTGTCNCCTSEDPCECTSYSGSDSKTSTGAWYDADGNIIRRTATWSCSGCGSRSDSETSSEDPAGKHQAYLAAVAYREKLQTYKQQCESASDIVNKWEYKHAPDLIFSYEQTFADPISGEQKTLVEEQEMVISTKEGLDAETIEKIEKYWPGWTEKPNQTSATGTKSNKDHKIKYGGPNGKDETFTYDKTTDYTVDYEHTIYYRPTVYYYSLVPTGKYVTDSYSFTDEAYLDIGYVFNVNVTTYTGEYNWWFTINNIGHYKADPKDPNTIIGPPVPLARRSNIQHSLDDYLDKHKNEIVQDFTDPSNPINPDGTKFTHMCQYFGCEEIMTPLCENCCLQDDPNYPDCLPPETPWSPAFYYRTIATEGTGAINPNNRDLGSNLQDEKGQSFVNNVESLGYEIYNDIGEYVEYVFEWTPSKQNEAKEYNKNNTYYNSINCNSDGKECTSDFITKFATKVDGRSKFKYYINGQWTNEYKSHFGGKYPDDDAIDEGIINYWP